MVNQSMMKKVRKEIKKDVKENMPVYFRKIVKHLGFWERCKLGLCIVFKREF